MPFLNSEGEARPGELLTLPVLSHSVGGANDLLGVVSNRAQLCVDSDPREGLQNVVTVLFRVCIFSMNTFGGLSW